MSGWRIVGAHIRAHRGIYSLGILLLVVSSLLNVWIPRIIGKFTDKLQQGNVDAGAIAFCAGLLVVIAFVRVFFVWTGRNLLHARGRVLTYNIRRDLYAKWGTLSPSYYHRHSIGDLLSHALSDVEVVRELMTMGAIVTIMGVSLLIAATI